MCGVVGIVALGSANQMIYNALSVLQHRGQDAAGMVLCESGRLFLHKQNGLVRDAFQMSHMMHLKGNMGIGHVRYPTAGCSSLAEAQPLYVNSPYGIALAHNGNLTNSVELKKDLFLTDRRHVNTNSDSEILLNVLAHELEKVKRSRLMVDDVFDAISRLYRRCSGGYAVVALITGFGIVAFRDPWGIRPLVFGRRETALGSELIIASESVSIDSQEFSLVRDVLPGEAVFVTKEGSLHTRQCVPQRSYSPCLFEFVYFARPDSIIDGVSVYKSRLKMGEMLADKIQREWPNHDIDAVIPIPDTGRTAALSLAYRLGRKYTEGFVKNRYITRTFIMPEQLVRRKSVRQKLNAIGSEFEGKNVLLVDDSIVRGTTSREIIHMAREAGAKKVYFVSAAPAVRYPNVYGIDIPNRDELVAYGRDDAEVAKLIGADHLIYQDIEQLTNTMRQYNPRISGFDTSCFTGEYVTGDVGSGYLDYIGRVRSDEAKVMHDRGEENLAPGL